MLVCTLVTAAVISLVTNKNGIHECRLDSLSPNTTMEHKLLINYSYPLPPSVKESEAKPILTDAILKALTWYGYQNKWILYSTETGKGVEMNWQQNGDVVHVVNYQVKSNRIKRAAKNYVSGLLKKSDSNDKNNNQNDKKVTQKPSGKGEDLSKRIIGGKSALQYVPVSSKFRETEKENMI